jgi:hypothetical protein
VAATLRGSAHSCAVVAVGATSPIAECVASTYQALPSASVCSAVGVLVGEVVIRVDVSAAPLTLTRYSDVPPAMYTAPLGPAVRSVTVIPPGVSNLAIPLVATAQPAPVGAARPICAPSANQTAPSEATATAVGVPV